MSSSKPYHELLKDPRWQKKRLEVMKASGFACDNCGDETETLHVHHGSYLKGLKPWEYPDRMLHCLCEKCHDHAESCLNDFRSAYGKLETDQIISLEMLINRIDDFVYASDKKESTHWLSLSLMSLFALLELDIPETKSAELASRILRIATSNKKKGVKHEGQEH